MNVRKPRYPSGLYCHLGILVYDTSILFSFSHSILHGYGVCWKILLIFFSDFVLCD